jgi:hypothetical protein
MLAVGKTIGRSGMRGCGAVLDRPRGLLQATQEAPPRMPLD